MEIKKHEQESHFSIWLIASILLHFFILLIIFFWYLENRIQQHLFKKNNHVIPLSPLSMAPQQIQKENNQKTAIVWKDLKKPKPEPKPEPIYTLILGRKAVTEPEQQTPEKKDKATDTSLKIEKSEQKSAQKSAQKPEIKQEPVQPTKQKRLQQESIEKTKELGSIPIQKSIDQSIAKTRSQRFLDLKEKLLQNPKESKKSLSEQNVEPFEINIHSSNNKTESSDPTIVKKKITLQDLKLGFSKFLQKGNNDILIQQGNTNQPPDAKALRMITYNQQLARTMVEAIHTHHRYHLVQNIHGLRPICQLTIQRNGTFVSYSLVRTSGNDIFDQIVQESLESIKLYPPVPNHISGDTFSAVWTFIH